VHGTKVRSHLQLGPLLQLFNRLSSLSLQWLTQVRTTVTVMLLCGLFKHMYLTGLRRQCGREVNSAELGKHLVRIRNYRTIYEYLIHSEDR
jgi:hypothetical protein